MRLLRNLSRRKLRTGLTVAGIMIGIWALVIFSSMAAKMDALVSGGSRYYADKVLVSSGGTTISAGMPMQLSAGTTIAALPGVDVVAPSVELPFDTTPATVSFGPGDTITGTPAGADKGRETFDRRLASGRFLNAADEGAKVAVLGSDIASKHALTTGGTIRLRGTGFTVVGVLEPTMTAPDAAIDIPFAAAQELLLGDLPPIIRDQVRAADLATSFVVYPTPGTDMTVLASQIESAVPSTNAMTGAEFDATVGNAIGALDSMVVGIGFISLIVGGLSIVNTMAMSVAERTREIGIRRAIGARRRRIVRELVTEAGLIGFIGGLIGLGLGALVVTVANEAGRASGTVLFDLNAGIAASSMGFAVVLGMLAGLVPAWSASRLDPVTALRFE
ncbi:MAG: ABC transporter permease [Chloroflexota bacterium]